MLKIAVCDDEELSASIIEEYIHEYQFELYQIDVFNSSSTLIQAIKNSSQYTIYFLDIEIDKVSGIDVAKVIREYDVSAFIVFVTSFKEYMGEVFQVHTFDYILKPVSKEKIHELLDKVSYISNTNKKQFVYSINNIKHYVSFGEIIYFEKLKRQTIIHTQAGKTIFYMNTNQILDQIDDHFTQIHTSYIINSRFIIEINKAKVILDCGLERTIELPISRKYKVSAYNEIIESFKKVT